MVLKMIFALIGIFLGGCLGFFGVFYLCMFIDSLNPPSPGSGAGSVGWVFTFITVPLFALVGCFSGAKLASVVQKNNQKIDASNFVIIPYESSSFDISKNAKPIDLSKNDLVLIDKIFTQTLEQYNSKQVQRFNEIDKQNPEYNLNLHNFTIQIEDYKRQYVPFVNKNEEKEVWINCFYGKWDEINRKEILHVKDGGNLYFNLKINLTQERYYDFIVNSET